MNVHEHIKAATRFKVYLGCLIVNVAVNLIVGLLVVWEVIDATKGLASIGIALNGLGIVSAALALGYVPYSGNPIEDPTSPDYLPPSLTDASFPGKV